MAVSAASVARAVGSPILLSWEKLTTGVSYDLLSTKVQADPYPVYREMRMKDPVHWSELARAWFLTRYAETVSVLKDNRFSVDGTQQKSNERMGYKLDEASPLRRINKRWMLFVDPPDHTRLRGLVNRAFTPKAVEGLRPKIQELVDGLLDQVQDRGHMDIVHDLGDPLPAKVLAYLLGLPAEDSAVLKPWADVVGMGIDPILAPEVVVRINKVILEAGEYFERHIEQRRRNPGDDLLSSLISVEEQGEKLSSDELLSLLFLFLAAGTETTTNLTCNGLYTILRHPDQLERLRKDPSLIESAIEEFLRFETPVQVTGRVANEDVEVGGKIIRKGHPVGLLLGAANRDPEQFPDPDRLDIGRTPNRHDAFSFGIHFCVGAPLGRAEAAIAIGTVLRRLPNLKLQSTIPQWRPTMNNRGLSTLPVTF
jgi:pimeloyl-[acyl-carrier protein] synthase